MNKNLLNDVVNEMIKKPSKLKFNLNNIIGYAKYIDLLNNNNQVIARLKIYNLHKEKNESIDIICSGYSSPGGTVCSARLIDSSANIIISNLTVSNTDNNANIVLTNTNLHSNEYIKLKANIYV